MKDDTLPLAAVSQSGKLTSERIVQVGEAFLAAKTLLSAVELGVFTVLAEGPLDLENIRLRIGIDPRGVWDFLDALVALGLLERRDGRYSNARDTDLFLDHNKATYIGDLLEGLNVRFGIWSALTTALQTGEPQSGPRASGNFPGLYADSSAREVFVRSMTARTLPVAKALAVRFPWHQYESMVDVGAAEGCLLVEIALAHPHISGGGFDLPDVRPLFNAYVTQHSLSGRLRFYPGDFFQDPIPAADVLILSRVLNNWDLATKIMLLKKTYDALPAGGTLIVNERLIDDDRRVNGDALLTSLNMLLVSTGGFNFTGADCVGWMGETGYRNIRVEALTATQSMIVGVK